MLPTMQIGQAFAQSGQNGPSIFPNTGLAARVKYMPTETSYVSVAAFDGVPGSLSQPHGTHIDLGDKDGALLVTEAGITPPAPDGVDGTPNKFGIGAWMYTAKQDDLVKLDANGNPKQQRQAGVYFLSSYQFYTNPKTERDAGAFLRAGVSDGDTAQTSWDYEVGMLGHGWVPTRTRGEIGLGLSQAHNSDKYMTLSGPGTDRNEYSAELYYRDALIPGITLQPDVQYIVNPGTTSAVKNATVVGLRFDISL